MLTLLKARAETTRSSASGQTALDFASSKDVAWTYQSASIRHTFILAVPSCQLQSSRMPHFHTRMFPSCAVEAVSVSGPATHASQVIWMLKNPLEAQQSRAHASTALSVAVNARLCA